MKDDEIGTTLLHIPSELTEYLGEDMLENIAPENLRQYNSDQLRDLCGGLVLHIQSQLGGRSTGAQSGQSGPGGMDVDA